MLSQWDDAQAFETFYGMEGDDESRAHLHGLQQLMLISDSLAPGACSTHMAQRKSEENPLRFTHDAVRDGRGTWRLGLRAAIQLEVEGTVE